MKNHFPKYFAVPLALLVAGSAKISKADLSNYAQNFTGAVAVGITTKITAEQVVKNDTFVRVAEALGLKQLGVHLNDAVNTTAISAGIGTAIYLGQDKKNSKTALKAIAGGLSPAVGVWLLSHPLAQKVLTKFNLKKYLCDNPDCKGICDNCKLSTTELGALVGAGTYQGVQLLWNKIPKKSSSQ